MCYRVFDKSRQRMSKEKNPIHNNTHFQSKLYVYITAPNVCWTGPRWIGYSIGKSVGRIFLNETFKKKNKIL